MSKLPEPSAGFQWNPGWNSWEQVIPAAMREEGVVPMYSEAKVKELIAERDAVLKMALEALEGWKNAGTFTSRIKACSPGDEAIAAIRKVLT